MSCRKIRCICSRAIPGDEEMALPPLDPFILKEYVYTMNMRPLPVITVCTIQDFTIKNLTKFNLINYDLNTKTGVLKFEAQFPTLNTTGNYALGGNLWFLSWIGNGPASIDVTNGKVTGVVQLEITKDADTGKKILQASDVQMELDYDDATLKIDGLFNKHHVLKRAQALINRQLNEYNKELWEFISSEFIESVNAIVKGIVNKSLVKMPYLVEYF